MSLPKLEPRKYTKKGRNANDLLKRATASINSTPILEETNPITQSWVEDRKVVSAVKNYTGKEIRSATIGELLLDKNNSILNELLAIATVGINSCKNSNKTKSNEKETI